VRDSPAAARPSTGLGASAIRWSGAAVFVLSLSYFLFSYAVIFGRPAAGTDWLPPVTFNVALFTVFAVHHTVCARDRVRQWVAGRLPPDLERSCYVWIASVFFIVVCALWRPVPGVAWEARGVFASGLYALQIAGAVLAVLSAAAIDPFELAGVRVRHSSTIEFRTSGPYGRVRHPIYSGWFLVVFAAPHMTMTRLVFAMASCVYVVIGMAFEERSLRRASGGAYDRYMRQVPWRIMPGVY
jgi:protein-S-isoprenylcysteine O-methyltransferase Ste14